MLGVACLVLGLVGTFQVSEQTGRDSYSRSGLSGVSRDPQQVPPHCHPLPGEALGVPPTENDRGWQARQPCLQPHREGCVKSEMPAAVLAGLDLDSALRRPQAFARLQSLWDKIPPWPVAWGAAAPPLAPPPFSLAPPPKAPVFLPSPGSPAPSERSCGRPPASVFAAGPTPHSRSPARLPWGGFPASLSPWVVCSPHTPSRGLYQHPHFTEEGTKAGKAGRGCVCHTAHLKPHALSVVLGGPHPEPESQEGSPGQGRPWGHGAPPGVLSGSCALACGD